MLGAIVGGASGGRSAVSSCVRSWLRVCCWWAALALSLRLIWDWAVLWVSVLGGRSAWCSSCCLSCVSCLAVLGVERCGCVTRMPWSRGGPRMPWCACPWDVCIVASWGGAMRGGAIVYVVVLAMSCWHRACGGRHHYAGLRGLVAKMATGAWGAGVLLAGCLCGCLGSDARLLARWDGKAGAWRSVLGTRLGVGAG